MAERLNVSRQAVSRWETGFTVPSTDNLSHLGRLYGVTLDKLLSYSAALPPEKPQEEAPAQQPKAEKAIIQREAGLYARRILSAIAEAGLDCRAMPVVFLGGGAGLMKRYLPQGSVLHPVILDDNKLNAQAYERLAGQVADHAG